MRTRSRILILAAYACSGFAGLVYQITWTRLLVLHVGSTTAAITTVVAAFMGGLAIGAGAAARRTPRMTAADAAAAYAALEIGAAAAALFLPFFLSAARPLLAWAYQDGGGNAAFAAIRTIVCLAAVTLPALLLGATYPLAIRASASEGHATAGPLYALNTAGAAGGALYAGFFLLPRLGLRRTVLVGAAASTFAAALALLAWAFNRAKKASGEFSGDAAKIPPRLFFPSMVDRTDMLAALFIVVATGFAGLLDEVAWTRAVASLLGPTTYAFAGIVFTLIAGLAIGGAIGASPPVRRLNAYLVIAAALGATAVAAWWGNIALGTGIPEHLAHAFAEASGNLEGPLLRTMALTMTPLLPVAIGLGLSFPATLRLAGDDPSARGTGFLYAANTAAGVAGTFLAAPLLLTFDLEGTLRIVPAAIILAAAVALAAWSRFRRLVPTLAAFGMLALAVSVSSSHLSWDRELLASGIYKYARTIPAGVDLDAVLKAATLVDYRDGEHATVAVTQFAGTRALVVDGKVDGSNGGDMLTQELVAHLPLLLHEQPKQVLVIGLGTGVTLASAVSHPSDRIDVVEISPEIVAASEYFSDVNHHALSDPRVHLIVGDGRSQLRLGRRSYDVIISEPSNPWVAGMAALFTRETFEAIRERLAPGGIVCQWLHTYDISEPDLRSIVATFATVFPQSTLWMVGDGDLLLAASTGPLDDRLNAIRQAWKRPGVAADLQRVGVMSPFEVLSLWAGGAKTIADLGAGSAIQTDDRMALEFSGPAAVYRSTGSNQVLLMRRVRDAAEVPPAIAKARAGATAADWRARGAMLQRIHIFDEAYENFARAFAMGPEDDENVSAYAAASVPAGKSSEAIDRLKARLRAAPGSAAARVALSKLLASTGKHAEAIAVANVDDAPVPVLEQLAALYADAGDLANLERTVEKLQELRPYAAKTRYLAATARFMQGAFTDALTQTKFALEAGPGDADTLNLQGDALANLGRFEEAQKSFDAALAAAPADATIFTNLGQLALAKGDARRAEQRFAAAVTLNPSLPAARDGLKRAQQLLASK